MPPALDTSSANLTPKKLLRSVATQSPTLQPVPPATRYMPFAKCAYWLAQGLHATRPLTQPDDPLARTNVARQIELANALHRAIERAEQGTRGAQHAVIEHTLTNRGASLVACVLFICCCREKPRDCLHPRRASVAAAEHRQSQWHACADVQASGVTTTAFVASIEPAQRLLTTLPPFSLLGSRCCQEPQRAGSVAPADPSPRVVTTRRLAMPPGSGLILVHAPARAAKAPPLLPSCLRRACGCRCPAPLRPARLVAAMADPLLHARLRLPARLGHARLGVAALAYAWCRSSHPCP